ncbi:MAG: tetratricopeptide repeat protein [Kiritimatiellae bacterium]|nr:tetratricopeptide repeat protein [Kiritimatiellia bacterium]
MKENLMWVIMVFGISLIGLGLGCGQGNNDRHFRKGLRAFGQGKYVHAKAAFEKSTNKHLGEHKKNSISYNYLGLSYWKLGELERAIDAFENSRTLNPDLMEPHYNLGILLYQSGDAHEAETLLGEAGLIHGSDPRPLEYLGHIHSVATNWPKSRRMLYEALARAPQSPRVLTALSLAELYAEGPPSAVSYLMEALGVDSTYPPALFNLALIYEHWLKDNEQAMAFYQKYLDHAADVSQIEQAKGALNKLLKSEADSQPRPKNEVYIAKKGSSVTVKDLLKKARKVHKTGGVKKALELCLQADNLAQKIHNKPLREKSLNLAVKLCFDQAKTYLAVGQFLEEEGKVQEALNAFKQAVTLDPTLPKAYIALAQTAIKIEEYDTAVYALRKAVRLDKIKPDLLWSLATVYDQYLALKQQAVKTYYEFERLFPSDPRVLKARKRLQELRPITAEAQPYPDLNPTQGTLSTNRLDFSKKEGFQRKLKFRNPRPINKNAAVQAYNRGTVYQERKDWDRAIYYYTRAIENDDTFVTAFYNLGLAYRAKGDFALSKDAYLYAIKLRPDMANARYNLALIYSDLRQDSAALKHLKEIIKRTPSYGPAHHLIGLVYAKKKSTYPLAKKHYQQFLQLAPDDASASSMRRWLETH